MFCLLKGLVEIAGIVIKYILRLTPFPLLIVILCLKDVFCISWQLEPL